MKALSIRQPWASLIRDGKKTIEVRSWITRFRGEFLVVASARPDGPESGAALCIVRLEDCRPMTPDDESAALCRWTPGAWAWVLTDVRPIRPLRMKGKLSFYEVSDSLIRASL